MPQSSAGFSLSLSCSLCAFGWSSNNRISHKTSCPTNSRRHTLSGSQSNSAAPHSQKTSCTSFGLLNCTLMHINTSEFGASFGLFHISYPNSNITAISSSGLRRFWQVKMPNNIICRPVLFCFEELQSAHSSRNPEFTVCCQIAHTPFSFFKSPNFGRI